MIQIFHKHNKIGVLRKIGARIRHIYKLGDSWEISDNFEFGVNQPVCLIIKSHSYTKECLLLSELQSFSKDMEEQECYFGKTPETPFATIINANNCSTFELERWLNTNSNTLIHSSLQYSPITLTSLNNEQFPAVVFMLKCSFPEFEIIT
jgi:hypothetical protein